MRRVAAVDDDGGKTVIAVTINREFHGDSSVGRICCGFRHRVRHTKDTERGRTCEQVMDGDVQ